MTRIGILGGTFDPVHYGHLHIAKKALQGSPVQRVLLMPSGNPPHKPVDRITPAHHRLEMCRIAADEFDDIEVSEVEINREDPCYSLDTVKLLQSKTRGVQYYYIIGADSLADLPNWYLSDQLVQTVKFIILKRPGVDIEDAIESLTFPRDKKESLRKGIVEARQLDISSTEIRKRIRQGEPVHDMVPEPVLNYINTHRLYR
ncbi:MAG: nicotinate-nucleotide adenylyltransferase [Planctomycetota bacterium]|nr:nicotinate-nucleotide adenylyltransferase [Planctomycetota bacterium]